MFYLEIYIFDVKKNRFDKFWGLYVNLMFHKIRTGDFEGNKGYIVGRRDPRHAKISRNVSGLGMSKNEK